MNHPITHSFFCNCSRFFGIGIVLLIFTTSYFFTHQFHSKTNYTTKRPSDLSKEFSLLDKTTEYGLSFSYSSPEKITSLYPIEMYVQGGGISVADINQDGFMDFYVVTSKVGEKNSLFINQAGTKFIDQADKWGIAQLNTMSEFEQVNSDKTFSSSISPLFFDYNSDGLIDLYVARLGCSRLYRNTGKRFIDVTIKSNLTDCKNAQGSMPIDYDKDGDLDLLVIRFFSDIDLFINHDEDIWVNKVYDADNGGQNTLYENLGNGQFQDVTNKTLGPNSRWSFDAGLGDLDGDGNLEIFVANDFGPDSMYKIINGSFKLITELLGKPDRRFGMGVSIDYPAQSNLPIVHISNAYHKGYLHEGNFLWKYQDKNSKIEDTAKAFGTNNCLWAWGSVFGDFDVNGETDLYVTNGFFTPAKLNDPKNLSFTMGTINSLPGFLTSKRSLLKSYLDNSDPRGIAFADRETDCLFWKDNHKFIDIAEAVGITDDWDGRAVASVDVENDGDLDLLVSTRNKGVRLLLNNLDKTTNWIGLTLDNSPLHKSLIGTEVIVTQADNSWRKLYTAGKTGFMAISDQRMHFGLKNNLPVNVSVLWPNGEKSMFKNLPAGKYHSVSPGSIY